MTNNFDLTFITNENDNKLVDRFGKLIKDTKFFDALVGYFYTSGFYSIYKSLEATEKIRILIGIKTDRETLSRMEEARQMEIDYSQTAAKKLYADTLKAEMEESEDSKEVEDGVTIFLKWLRSGKIEIRAYPSANIHAKLYVMTFDESDRDRGRVITGSSNFTRSGLIDNLELNVELKNASDYQYALDKFNQLWSESVDVSEKYIETIEHNTWLSNDVSPYELYLKFLYEYFKDDISQSSEVVLNYKPINFKKLEYQEQAVINAKKIVQQYGGVFISDVVGLGKTFMATMLASQLPGRTLVIAPPTLLDENNPGSWPRAIQYFNVPADWESIGKLDKVIDHGLDRYTNIIVDEAHRFRTEQTGSYEKLSQICRGKRVILVTATPYNNSPRDVLNQIKLFQPPRKSTIPNLPNLESFFIELESRLKNLDRQKDLDQYVRINQENSKEIREKVLKYLMVRRTRSEIENYFDEDLKKQGVKFPKVSDPTSVFYQLNDEEERIFSQTSSLIATDLKYSRYSPLLYFHGPERTKHKQAQENMTRFMKVLFIKRLESSFYAFRMTLGRFINSYEQFLSEYEKGKVWISSDYSNKVFEYLAEDNLDALQKLVDDEKAEQLSTDDFDPGYKDLLENDLRVLKEIDKLWQQLNRDPKLDTFVKILSNDTILKTNKLIIFTESKDTAKYLATNIERLLNEKVLLFTGESSRLLREQVIENFDAKSENLKNDYRLLITTEVLAEGVNLHRSNVVVNYDIPWNPTRMMQRVGRINRVDTQFDSIYTFNFFPTKQANDEIKLKESAQSKIAAFISLLGSDAPLLTEGENVESFKLFDRMTSKSTITGDDDFENSELKYLKVIREIRDDQPAVFDRIKKLPKKARTSKPHIQSPSVVTYFRKGKVQKFFQAISNVACELDFITAAKLLECDPDQSRSQIGQEFYEMLDANKYLFTKTTTDLVENHANANNQDYSIKILRTLSTFKDLRQLTDDQEEYLTKLKKQFEIGNIPKTIAKSAYKALNIESGELLTILQVIGVLQTQIPDVLLESHVAETTIQSSGPREVILSEYLSS